MKRSWEKLVRYSHYARAMLACATWRKLTNFMRIEWRLFRNNPNVCDAFPWSLVLDLSNACPLQCPLCVTGQRRLIHRKNRMSFENYVTIVEPLKKHLFMVFLYNWGEPFLNRDIYRVIKWNKENRLVTFVSSNLNVDIDADALVQSRLDHLVISADGITQEVYEKYRVGGQIERVFQNLSAVVAAKRQSRSSLPFIEWQCLVTRHNENHLADIKKKALALGANEVRFVNLNFFAAENPEEIEQDWLPQNPAYRVHATGPANWKREGAVRRPCFWLWRSIVISADGGMQPCCLYDVPAWGNAIDEPMPWKNKVFNEARRSFSHNEAPRSQASLCDQCRAPFLY